MTSGSLDPRMPRVTRTAIPPIRHSPRTIRLRRTMEGNREAGLSDPAARVGPAAAPGRPGPAPGGRVLLLRVGRGRLAAAHAGRALRPAGGLGGLAVVVAGGRLPGLHAAAALPPGRGPGAPAATGR